MDDPLPAAERLDEIPDLGDVVDVVASAFPDSQVELGGQVPVAQLVNGKTRFAEPLDVRFARDVILPVAVVGGRARKEIDCTA